MFDLVGHITTSGTAQVANFASAWDNQRELLAVDYRMDQLTGGRLHLCTLSRNAEEVNQAQKEGVLVAVSGECYYRLNASGSHPIRSIHAEEIMERYRTAGFQFLGQVKGNFILLISDSRKQETFIITAPLCLRSLYYRETGSGLFFSSSLPVLKKLLRESEIDPALDGASIIEYYLFDFTLGEHTMLAGISELQAGKLLQIGDGRLSVRSYSDPLELFPLTNTPLDEKEAGQLLENTLENNITLLTDGPQRTAIALTGGYDSRSIAALAGADFQKYQYYSYGSPHSWDIKIPKVLASRNHLNYTAIKLNGDFKRDFSRYARMAIQLGDGAVEASRANYPYVYAHFLRDKASILTGLFGSELIKTPSSRGGFIDENILSILRAGEPAKAFDNLYDQMLADGPFPVAFALEHRHEVYQRVLKNRFVCNELGFPQKLFYFILMIGARKYFSKEIKLERFFINNKTPFFDVDFIQALLRTPFPWVYNWTDGRSLAKNLKIHRVYANLISRNEALLDTITTHGFKPKHLLSKWHYPLLAVQYYRTKKKMAQESRLSFEENIRHFFASQTEPATPGFPIKPDRLQAMENDDFKNYVKLNSLRLWAVSLGESSTAQHHSNQAKTL